MSMSSLRMVEEALPAGFRFHPTDSELVCDYLMKMIAGCDQPPHLIVVDLNKMEPWEIPMIACVGGKEYYFYSQRDRKYATGHRTNRATISGYWKATGKDRAVLRKGTLVGMRKTLVFYQGRAPKGRKTEWVMHEFRLEGPLGPPKLSSSYKDQDWVLCRVFFKNTREVIEGKVEEMEYYSNREENSPSSSSLPPLIDQFVTFDHQTQTTNPNNNNEHEQVPCFSNLFATDQNQTTTHHPSFSYFGMENPYFSNPKNMTQSSFGFGGLLLSADHYGSYLNTNNTATTSSSSCDQEKVLKAVLNQLTCKIESSGPSNNMQQQVATVTSPSFGEASTSDSFLSEVALSTMWNNNYN